MTYYQKINVFLWSNTSIPNMIIIESKRKKPATILKKYPGAMLIDVTSKAADEWVKLSPFYPHGGIPVPFSDGYSASCVEAIWQGLKVFEHCDVDTTLFYNTTLQGLKRTVRQFGKPLGHRKGVHGTELFSYIDARKHIYIPTYKWVLENRVQDLIIQLRELSESKTIVLLDYNTNANVDDPSKPLSHASLVKAYIESVHYQVVSKLYNGDVIIKKKQEHANIYDYAIVDQNNKVIVPFKYHCIEEFHDGMYKVSFSGKYGLLDKSFNEIVSPIYDGIDIFEDLIRVVKRDYFNSTCGLLSKTSEVIFPCVYLSISVAAPGLVWIENKNKEHGLATIDGRILIEPKFGQVDSFIDGIAKVNIGRWNYDNDDREWQLIGSKWGTISLDGHEVIPPLYESIEIDTTNKLYHVSKVISFYKSVSGVLNESGKLIIKDSKGEYILASEKFEWQEDFDENSKSVVYKNGATGIVNEKFQLVVHINSDNESKEFIIPEEYDWGYDSASEFVVVQKDDKNGVIKSTGDLIVECIYHNVEILSENNKFLFSCANFKAGKSLSPNPLSPNYEWAVININGQRLFSSVFDEVTLLGHELLALKNDNGKYIIADFKGQIKIEALFDKVHPFDWPGPARYGSGIPQKDEDVQYAIVGEANKFGVINSFGQVVIQPKYRFLQVINSNQFFADGVYINLQGERIASKGKVTIPITNEYEEAKIINNGFISVKKDGLYGCINHIGSIIIPFLYQSLTFYEDLVVAELYDNLDGTVKRGVINFMNEQVVTLSEQFDEIKIDNNLILCRQNCFWGAYTLQGRLVCNPSYNHIETLTNSLIKVGKDSVEYEDFRYNDWVDGEQVELIGSQECNVIYWGIIDMNGKCILPLDYRYIENNNDGLIMIKHLEGKYGLLDMMGNTVLEPTYKSIGSFVDGLAIVSKPYTYYDNKDERYRTGSIYGVIDYSFREVIPCDYKKIEYKRELGLFLTDVGYLSLDGRYIAELDGKHICINKEFLYCKPFNNGYAIAVKKTGGKAKYALINSKSENILPTIYDRIIRLQNGLYTLQIDDKWGLADTDGCIILPASYEYMGKVINNYVVIMKNEQWGLLSIETKAIIINTNASYLGPCMDGLCRINVGGNYSQSTKKVDGGRWGFVNPFGQIIIEPQYDLAYGFSEGFAAVKSCGKWGFINKEGINIVPCIYEYFEASYYNGKAHLSNDGTEFTFDNQGNIIESHEIRDYNNNYYDDD